MGWLGVDVPFLLSVVNEPRRCVRLLCIPCPCLRVPRVSLELRDRMGRVLAFAGPLTSTKPYNPDDVCEWLLDGKDHVTITDDTVYYRFEVSRPVGLGDVIECATPLCQERGPRVYQVPVACDGSCPARSCWLQVPESGNPAQLWGFALTASIVAFKGDERSLRTAANLTLIEHKVCVAVTPTHSLYPCTLPLPPPPPHPHPQPPLFLPLRQTYCVCARRSRVWVWPPGEMYTQRNIETLVRDAAMWTPAMDAKLVEFMNDWSDESGRSAEEMGPLELRPTPQQLKFKYELLAEVSVQQLYFRAAVVRNFNARCAICVVRGP